MSVADLSTCHNSTPPPPPPQKNHSTEQAAIFWYSMACFEIIETYLISRYQSVKCGNTIFGLLSVHIDAP